MMRKRLPIIHLTLALLLVFIWGGQVAAYTPEECIECHTGSDSDAVLKISLEHFNRSVHAGEITCEACHSGIVDEDHQATVGSGAVDCSQCHEQENRHGLSSPENRPHCYDCHTRHHIQSSRMPQAATHGSQLQTTCSGCHPAQCGRSDYLSWFTTLRISSHPKQDWGQSYSRTDCLGCHQGLAVHGEVEPLTERNCHVCHQSEKGRRSMWGRMHPAADADTQPGVFAAAMTYQLALLLLIWGGFRYLVGRLSNSPKRKD